MYMAMFIKRGFHLEKKFYGGRSVACVKRTDVNIHDVNSLTHMTTMNSFKVTRPH